MSKGEIVSSEGEGLYTVRLKYARERVDEELAQINQKLADLAVAVPEKKLAVLQAESEASSIEHQIDLVIIDYQQDPDAHRDALVELQTKLANFQTDLAQLRWARDNAIMRDLALKKRRGQLNSIPEDKVLQTWCADFTEELSGDVGLIDINDEGSQGVIIQPGYEGSAAYQGERDGQLVHRLAQSAAQVYFNAAILPGVQKWMPRYRVGTISNIDNDQCTVFLDQANSSAQSLDINDMGMYSAVPIVYMDCNGSAFEDGDRVVVRFTQSGPLVVGFEREPKPCDLPVWIMGNQSVAYEMEPDLSAVKRTVATGNFSFRVAVFDGQVAALKSTEPNGGDITLSFYGGPSYTQSEVVRFWGLCSSPSGFWGERIDINIGGPVDAVKFSPAGNPEREITLQGLDGERLNAGGSNAFRCDDETIVTHNNDDLAFWALFASASSGAVLGLGQRSGHFPFTAMNNKYIYIVSGASSAWECTVYDRFTRAAVGSFSLPSAQYRCAAASNTKFYAFSLNTSVIPAESYAWVFRLDGTGATFEKAVDLRGSFGIESVFGCDVDGALLFR